MAEPGGELAQLREWREGASLTLSELREQIGQYRKALRNARGWLNMIASERPESSDIHAVLAEIDAALSLALGEKQDA